MKKWQNIVIVCVILGCAGSMPKIPDSPEGILANGEAYFARGKFFQATELFRNFTTRYPGHDRSDYAQFMLAESRFNDGDYALAAVEYQLLLNNYSYSDYVDDALFKVGVCYYEQSPKPQRDQQSAKDALSRFNQFLQTFPNSPLVDDAREYVRLIHAKLAEKEFNNGKYYFKRKKFRAAMIYFDKIIDNYPDNEFWVRALFLKGVILQDRGDKDAARQNLARVLSYPDDLDVKDEARARLEALGP